MIQSLLMLSGSGQPVQSPLIQATLIQPPASTLLERTESGRVERSRPAGLNSWCVWQETQPVLPVSWPAAGWVCCYYKLF